MSVLNIGNANDIAMGRPHFGANRQLVALTRVVDTPIQTRMSAIYQILKTGLGITVENKSNQEYMDIIPTLRQLLSDTNIKKYIQINLGKDETYIHPVMKAIYEQTLAEAQSQIDTVKENIVGVLQGDNPTIS